MIKAIQTLYNGHSFRSRLEARWAVFLEKLDVKYAYEPEGFDLDGLWYLPDFWVPEWNCWIEIKPDIPVVWKLNDAQSVVRREYLLCKRLASESNRAVVLIGGDPWARDDSVGTYERYDLDYGIAVFSSYVTTYSPGKTVDDKGVVLNLFLDDKDNITRLKKEFYSSDKTLFGHLTRNYSDNPQYFTCELPSRDDILQLIEMDKEYFRNKNGFEHPGWRYGIVQDKLGFIWKDNRIALSPVPQYSAQTGKLLEAYAAARQESFDRGKPTSDALSS